MATFKNAYIPGVGITPVVIYTVPAATSAVIIGINIANVTGASLGFSLNIKDGSVNTFVVKDFRVANGTREEIMKGNKLVLTAGQQILGTASSDASFDIILSILEGV
jgi:secreted protein with Ig-like and vWFA domain